MKRSKFLLFFLLFFIDTECSELQKQSQRFTPTQNLLWLAASFQLKAKYRFPLTKNIEATVSDLLNQGAKPNEKEVVILYLPKKNSRYSYTECFCIIGPAFQYHKKEHCPPHRIKGLNISKKVDEAILEWELL